MMLAHPNKKTYRVWLRVKIGKGLTTSLMIKLTLILMLILDFKIFMKNKHCKIEWSFLLMLHINTDRMETTYRREHQGISLYISQCIQTILFSMRRVK